MLRFIDCIRIGFVLAGAKMWRHHVKTMECLTLLCLIPFHSLVNKNAKVFIYMELLKIERFIIKKMC